MRTGQIARRLAPSAEQADTCFAAGLLHDIGKLLLASALPERYDQLSRATAVSGRSFAEEETLLGGCAPQLRLGVYLLNLWGLPWPVVEAIANHAVAPSVEQGKLGPAGAVYLGCQLLSEASIDACGGVDLAFVERVGLGSRLGEWRAHAAELVAA
jgi:HD-like signal output (HDOD) protein